MSKQLLPVALDVDQRPVLVVGGGAVAARKAAALIECGAKVTVVAPGLAAGFPEPVERRPRTFRPGDCLGFDLVVAATDDASVNALVRSEARSLRIWVNDAGDPNYSDFHTASTLRRGPIAIGVTTGNTSPALARHLRDCVEAAVGPEYAQLVDLAAGHRLELRQRGQFWNELLASEVLALLRSGHTDEAASLLDSLAQESQHEGEAEGDHP